MPRPWLSIFGMSADSLWRQGGRLAVEDHPDDPEPDQDDRHRVCTDPFGAEDVPRAVGEPPDHVEHDSREERQRVEPERDAPRERDVRHDASKGRATKNLSASRLRRPFAPEGRDGPVEPTAGPRPPGLDLRIRAAVLIDPEQERE